MIDKIIYTNEKGDSITLSHTAPYFLSNPEGFDGVETDTRTSQSIYQEGVKVHSNKVKERVLTLNCELLIENEQEREVCKRKLYKVFSPSMTGSMKIYTEATEKAATGLVVIQAPIFKYDYKTRNELTEFQVQLLMPMPYFESPNPHRLDMGGDIGNFFFDFEISEYGRELSYKSDSLVTNLINPGDVSTPITLIFKARNTVKNPKLFNVYTKKFIQIDTIMNKGDEIKITTHVSNKRIILNEEHNLINRLAPGSSFMWLDMGDNIIRYSAEEGEDNLSLELYFNPYYLGV